MEQTVPNDRYNRHRLSRAQELLGGVRREVAHLRLPATLAAPVTAGRFGRGGPRPTGRTMRRALSLFLTRRRGLFVRQEHKCPSPGQTPTLD